MSRPCLAFAFATFAAAILIASPFQASAQTNSSEVSQMPGPAPEPPVPARVVKDSIKAAKAKSDSVKAAKAKSKKKSKAASADSAKADSASTASPAAPVVPDTAAKASAAPTPAAPAVPPAPDSANAAAAAVPESLQVAPDTAKAAVSLLDTQPEPQRIPPDMRLFNDPTLIAKEYGFGIVGSLVAGTLGFYIGSGIETAIVGDRRAHKGTLSFTGIRYDNFKGAFWGGATGMILGSALTTYFVGQTDEEDGGFFMTLLGTTAAAAGSYYVASLMGVNDEIDWKPFMPLLVIPSLGGTAGFNISRWYHDREREATVGKQASLRLHAPGLAWGRGPGGDRLEIRAVHLTF